MKWEVVGGWVLMNGSHVAATRGFLGLVVGNFRGRGTLRQDPSSEDLGKAKRWVFFAGSGWFGLLCAELPVSLVHFRDRILVICRRSRRWE